MSAEAESKNVNVEGALAEGGDLITPNTWIKYAMQSFKIVVFGLILTIYVAKNNMKRKDLKIREKIGKSLYPLVLTAIAFFIHNSPKPKRAYMLSVLYEDDPIKSDYRHKSSKKVSGRWPFIGSAVIRLNGEPHIFVGGGQDQKDALLYFDNKTNRFIDLIDKTNLSGKANTYSAVSFRVNKDKLDDLVVGRKDGVYLYIQKKDSPYQFTVKKILEESDQVPLALSISDYNRDGRPDIYVSYFTPIQKYRGTVFNDSTHGRKNVLLQGEHSKESNEEIVFKDVTKKVNAGGLPYNTFTAAFIDLDNNQWPDLVLSHDSGEVEILENKEGKFKSRIPFKEKGNWMGLASGDIDDDGDQDLFLTNLGTDVPADAVSEGDIKPGQKQTFQHVLLRNDGKFKFAEISKELGISGKGFGWGALFADLNTDSKLDLMFAENTKIYPMHFVFPRPGHFYQYDSKKQKFSRKFKYHNHNFGQTPLFVDIDKDDRKDIVWINMDGPVLAYLNKNKQHNYVVVDLPEDTEFVNAIVTLETGTGKKQTQQNIQGGVGFGSDSSNRLMFGLGKENKVKKIVVKTINGKSHVLTDVKINSVVKPVLVKR